MTDTSRRRLLAAFAAAPAVLAAPSWARASVAEARSLHFTHLHTGERLKVEYFGAGAYVPEALREVDRLLRDFRTGDVSPIDPRLLDLLHGLALRIESRQPFQIISGYRSPHTNAALRGKSEHSGVAKRSLHMVGQAVDIRLADVALGDLRKAALALGRGGVGYYPGSNFVHVDTGGVRSW
ncbi:DUF882 domain-containing protein [Aquabacterium sp. A7-Y]|uniref:DUF882 domain-containing protein n=1 Tax=Aquabacterium sp. A7-Y TaxID=1349605 RepID=UPI00223CF242|nr:DUF882 domain-containing protein [Aquabacterium sp. A7-Y]MCW7536936.1 DUF882 domain-containing protein [Aquabacterium sp. A7-Y]